MKQAPYSIGIGPRGTFCYYIPYSTVVLAIKGYFPSHWRCINTVLRLMVCVIIINQRAHMVVVVIPVQCRYSNGKYRYCVITSSIIGGSGRCRMINT